MCGQMKKKESFSNMWSKRTPGSNPHHAKLNFLFSNFDQKILK
jgi:hypothetical protein